MTEQTSLLLLMLCGYLLAISQSRTISRNVNTEGKEGNEVAKEPFTLNEIVTYVYPLLIDNFDATWISDEEFMYLHRVTNNVERYNVMSGKTEQIFEDRNSSRYYNEATLSNDGKYFLLSSNIQRIYRHSTTGNYDVYNRKNGTYYNIADGALVSSALWSPVGNNLVYILDNNIYYVTLDDSQTKVRKLTKNGEPGIIYNGVADWIYEEEVLRSARAVWFSPDGRYLCYATFNDSVVEEINYSYYGDSGSFEHQYPIPMKLKYPKVGTPNPLVSLWVIDLADPSSKSIPLEAPTDVVGSDHILYIVNWNEKHLIATWTNRMQNESQLVMYAINGTANPILHEKEAEGWLQPNPLIKASPKFGLHLEWSNSGTSAGRFYHIIRYDYDGKFTSPVDLTPGPSEVISISAVDSRRGKVYYLATAPGEPSRQNLYSVPLDASQKPTCISCNYLTPEGNKCTYATATFSTEQSYYSLTCSGPDLNTVAIYETQSGKLLTFWTNNTIVRKILSRKLMPQQKDLIIPVNGYNSHVRLLLPPNFNENKSYPMLVNVYGGPNTNKITDQFNIDYQHYLTTNKDTICAYIDGRGSAHKGSNMLFEIYRNFGTVEVEDTIAVTKALQKRYSWIDASRTGIWGWSYGGFTTGMVLATDTDSVFKCGISVAPVTSWIYYDSIYTERYMGLPTEEDKLAGYNRTDISRRVEGIRGKKYMLIQGTADDNVHVHQAMLLAKKLQQKNIDFDLMIYPDQDHSILNTRPHLYTSMIKFWTECFDLADAH